MSFKIFLSCPLLRIKPDNACYKQNTLARTRLFSTVARKTVFSTCFHWTRHDFAETFYQTGYKCQTVLQLEIFCTHVFMPHSVEMFRINSPWIYVFICSNFFHFIEFQRFNCSKLLAVLYNMCFCYLGLQYT